MGTRTGSLLRMLLAGLFIALSASCATSQFPEGPAEEEDAQDETPVSYEPEPAFRLSLRGDPFSSTELSVESIGTIPFGRWLNGIPVKAVKYGFEFSAALEDCSDHGCVVQTTDNIRVLVSGRGLSRAVRLSLYDEGWHRAGAAGINDAGWLAIPMASPSRQHEIWIVKENGRMHKRIPFTARGAVIVRWQGNSRLFIMSGAGTVFRSERVMIQTGKVISATLMEPWWYSCSATVTPSGVGLAGDVADLIGDKTGLPIYRKGAPAPGRLELTESVRPMSGEGLASPVKVRIDCEGRINVVTAKGMAIWCMRFSPDGAMEGAKQIGGGLAGDFRGIYIDWRGRFHYLETELEDDRKTPARLRHYILK